MIWLRGRAVKCFSLLVHRVLVRKPLLESMKYKQFTIKFVERMEYQHFQGLVAVWLAGCLAGWLPGWLAGWLPACLVGLLLCLLLAAQSSGLEHQS